MKWPGIKLDLWGDSELTALTAELGGPALRRYWFASAPPTDDEYRQRFARAQASWLHRRYVPDQHCAGQIEADLELRTAGTGALRQHRDSLLGLRRMLSQVVGAVGQLPRFSEFSSVDGGAAAIDRWCKWAQAAQAELRGLLALLDEPRPFPVVVENPAPGLAERMTDLLQILDQLEDGRRTFNPFKPVRETLYSFANAWERRTPSPNELHWLGRMPRYVAGPGCGKTHAFAHAVRRALDSGTPAILVRGRDLDARSSLDSMLPVHLGLPQASLEDSLHALESAAVFASVNRASSRPGAAEPVRRFLIAVDGLDESRNPGEWAGRLRELDVVGARYPRVLFAVTARPVVVREDRFDWIQIEESDAPIEAIRDVYLGSSEVRSALAGLEWALGTPLAIRLYAELVERSALGGFGWRDLQIDALLTRKLELVEGEARERLEGSWPESTRPVTVVLESVASFVVEGLDRVDSDMLLDRVEGAIQPHGVVPRGTLHEVIEYVRDRGLLLETRQHDGGDPFARPVQLWEPAYQVLTDYALAIVHWRGFAAAQEPELGLLRYYPNVLSLLAARMGDDLFQRLRNHLWEQELSPEDRLELALTALRYSDRIGPDEVEWVQTRLCETGQSCRFVLSALVVPHARVPESPVGPRFVHDVLIPMSVAERDQFWSLPANLAPDAGMLWSVRGELPLRIELFATDHWDGAPLLLAWALTNVDARLRAHVRSHLATWAEQNMASLPELVRAVCETNDPQMADEFIATVAYVVGRHNDIAALEPVVQALAMSLGDERRVWTTSSVVQTGAAIATARLGYLASSSPPERPKPAGTRLEIDEGWYRDNSHQWASAPVDFDLCWYVVPHAVACFEEVERHGQVRAESLYPSARVLSAAQAGEIQRIKPLVQERLRREAEESRRLVSEARSRARSPDSDGNAAQENPGLEAWLDALTDHECELLKRGLESPWQPRMLPLEDGASNERSALKEFFAQYRSLEEDGEVNFPKLAMAYATAYAKRLGWSQEVFRGKPAGGGDEDGIGVDIAILREYRRATHGDRSPVEQFQEKYVWAAMHDLVGRLASFLPAAVDGRRFEPPVPAPLVSERVLVRSDVELADPDECLAFDGLLPEPSGFVRDQRQAANEWVANAPLLDPTPMLLPDSSELPEWAKDRAWVVVRAFLSACQPDSQGDQVVWATAFVVPDRAVPLLVEDAALGLLSEGLHQQHAGVSGALGYLDPAEVVWAPWMDDIEVDASHVTIDADGRTEAIPLKALTTQFLWKPLDGETEEWLPAKWVREIAGVTAWRRGRLLQKDGRVVAFALRAEGPSWRRRHRHFLLLDREFLQSLCKRLGFALCWGVRVWREPAVHLRFDESSAAEKQPWTTRETVLLARLTDGGVERTVCSDKLREHGDRRMRPGDEGASAVSSSLRPGQQPVQGTETTAKKTAMKTAKKVPRPETGRNTGRKARGGE